MPTCEPFEALPFTLQVDSRPKGVPFDVVVADVERQSSQIVSPFRDERMTGSEFRYDSRYGLVVQHVLVSKG